MFRAKTDWVGNLGAYEMIRGDQQDFSVNGWKFGIAVMEVRDWQPVMNIADELIVELRILKIEKGEQVDGKHDRRKELDFAYLFVVNLTTQTSQLLIWWTRAYFGEDGLPWMSAPMRERRPATARRDHHSG